MGASYWCYFDGGDADGRFELIEWHDNDSDLVNGNPANGIMRGPGASVYRRTRQVVRYAGRVWTVWEHHGDWVAYSPLTAPTRRTICSLLLGNATASRPSRPSVRGSLNRLSPGRRGYVVVSGSGGSSRGGAG
jgi:hypothetical protein